MEELEKLLVEVCEAVFECGEWRSEESDEDYETVSEREFIARFNLTNALKKLVANQKDNECEDGGVDPDDPFGVADSVLPVPEPS